jgi:hypothetical protein
VNRWFLLVLLLLSAVGAGCQAPGPEMTPTQWAAIETREVEGKPDDVLRAVAAVVLDKGYYFAAADKDAGIITAAYVPPMVQDAFRRSGGMRGPVMSDSIAVWVVPSDRTHCEVRLQRRVLGQRTADERSVTLFWAAVQRRMLGGDAAPPAAPLAARTPEGAP